jgi:coniferyl-aldehyde dehydrogenase
VGRIPLLSPAGETEAVVPLRRALELQSAAALAAGPSGRRERDHDLAELARFVRDNRSGLIAAIDADYGHRSAHETTMLEILPVLAAVRHARHHLARWMRPERRGVDRLSFGLGSNRVIPQPLGVVGVIVPWNFPLNLSLVPLVSILAAGNRALVKMSENSRHLAQFLIERIPAYFPPEKLQVFDETGGVGVAFSSLPLDHLLFTGSAATGRAVMAAAARNLCPVTLELGGKSPAIVAPDFDLQLAAERILFTKCLNAGQICTTVDYAFVPRARLEDFVALAQQIVPRRYASLDSPDYSSIIDARALRRLCGSLEEARARGARVLPLLPGAAVDEPRRRLAPHLVIGAPEDCALMREEIFGPILPVLPYDDLEQVLEHINRGPRPLAIYPFSGRRALIDHILARTLSGGVTVNDVLMHVGQDELPFGGVGESGMGHYHGREGFLTFSKLRPVFEQSRWSTTRWLEPPYGRLTDRLLGWLTR